MNAIDPRSQDALRAELTELLPPPPVPGFAPEREREVRRAVLAAALPSRPARSAPRRRVWVRFAVPAVACALAAGGVLLAAPPERPGGGTPAVRAEGASAVLERAALAAAASPAPNARAGEFVYVESLVARSARSAAGGPAEAGPAHRRQVWLSADGSLPGLLREEGAADSVLSPRVPVYEVDRPGAAPRKTFLEQGPPSVTAPTHAYVAGLPTDPEALLRLVREQTRAAGGDADQRAFDAIGTLLAETWAPPRVTAALYGAAARVPGVTVLPSARDAAGREGVAVARTSAAGEQTQWVFDRSTSVFLGQRTVLVRATDAGPAGTVLNVSAVLAKAAVARAGQLPG